MYRSCWPKVSQILSRMLSSMLLYLMMTMSRPLGLLRPPTTGTIIPISPLFLPRLSPTVVLEARPLVALVMVRFPVTRASKPKSSTEWALAASPVSREWSAFFADQRKHGCCRSGRTTLRGASFRWSCLRRFLLSTRRHSVRTRRHGSLDSGKSETRPLHMAPARSVISLSHSTHSSSRSVLLTRQLRLYPGT